MTTARKGTGLAAFTRKPQPVAMEADTETTGDAPPARPRRRGKGERVSIPVRFTHDQWRRVHELALTEGVSIQDLCIQGLSRLMKEHGLKDL